MQIPEPCFPLCNACGTIACSFSFNVVMEGRLGGLENLLSRFSEEQCMFPGLFLLPLDLEKLSSALPLSFPFKNLSSNLKPF